MYRETLNGSSGGLSNGSSPQEAAAATTTASATTTTRTSPRISSHHANGSSSGASGVSPPLRSFSVSNGSGVSAGANNINFIRTSTMNGGGHCHDGHGGGGGSNGAVGGGCGTQQHCKFGYHMAVPMSKRTPGNDSSSTSTPHVIAMVGLPARGKTYISKKLSRYLNWIGINTKVFNLGDYRREEDKYSNHELFNPDNKEGRELRERVCMRGLDDVLHWLEHEAGEVAVFDATNTTRARRKFLYDKVVMEKGFKLFFLESLCNDPAIIEANIRQVKVSSPDYNNYSPDQVVADFMERIKHYEKQYEEIDENLEPKYSFIKTYNAGTKILVHKHEGHIQSRIVYYMMNCHILHRTIYLTRHGESYNNIHGRIGGDSELSPRGERFAVKLAQYIKKEVEDNKNSKDARIWTSWMKRTIDTAKHIEGIQERWKTLNEIDSGVCDDLTYEEIRSRWPTDFESRDVDKFRYRYPRGESYEDLVARLEPVIMELERKDFVVVVGHQAVNRCLLGYFLEISEEDLPWQEIPLHSVIKLSPRAYGCGMELIDLNVPCVSTHRGKPDTPGFLEERFTKGHRQHLENVDGIEEFAAELERHLCVKSSKCGKYKREDQQHQQQQQQQQQTNGNSSTTSVNNGVH